jgi:predicted DNA-binding transcriptional regulator AlpA
MSVETRLLNEREAASLLGLSVATLRRRRLLRHPPAWAKLGARVLYKESELIAFIEANMVRLEQQDEDKPLDRRRISGR